MLADESADQMSRETGLTAHTRGLVVLGGYDDLVRVGKVNGVHIEIDILQGIGFEDWRRMGEEPRWLALTLASDRPRRSHP
ncbi:MAG: hypothetical protein U1F43_26335 [Myxococcota bacterium]